MSAGPVHAWGVDVSLTHAHIVAVHPQRPRTPSHAPTPQPRTTKREPLPARLHDLAERVADQATTLRRSAPPWCIFIECPTGRHPQPKLLAAYGVIMQTLAAALDPYTVIPLMVSEWKKASVGYGNASKQQVAHWARSEGCPADWDQDLYDAYGIARGGLGLASEKG